MQADSPSQQRAGLCGLEPGTFIQRTTFLPLETVTLSWVSDMSEHTIAEYLRKAEDSALKRPRHTSRRKGVVAADGRSGCGSREASNTMTDRTSIKERA